MNNDPVNTERTGMDHHTFNKFREIVYTNSGIALNDTKEAMVSARIAKRMRALGFSYPSAVSAVSPQGGKRQRNYAFSGRDFHQCHQLFPGAVAF